MANKETGVKPTSANGETKMTAADGKFFSTMFKYLPANMDIDWEGLARELNLKNANVAKVRCRQIRTKLGVTGPGTGSGTPSSPTSAPKANANANKVKKPRKPAKGKQPKNAPAPEISDDDGNDGEMAVEAEDGEA
ncbi:hypothetical protein HD806DRAFT_537029 [Xylariaceae sp. AK1471]|nr:hypothetical protein HD806DRAFT_537029 [Xylariaceae sp. AK1471]